MFQGGPERAASAEGVCVRLCAGVPARGCARTRVGTGCGGEGRRGGGAASLGVSRWHPPFLGTRSLQLRRRQSVSSPVSPLRAGLLGHRSGGDASRFAKQFFSQLGIIRQREKVRTGMVANRLGAQGPRGAIGASWLKMPGSFAPTPSPRRSLSLWTQSDQLAEGEKGTHIY